MKKAEPLTSLNPTMTIGAQIAEAVLVHEPKISRDALRARVLELMDMTHAKTCRILEQLGRAWPRPADEPALNAHSSTYRCLRIPR